MSESEQVDQSAVMALLNAANINDPALMLNLTQQLRVEALKTLLAHPSLLVADSKLAANVRAFAADMDKQTLTQQKLQQEKESAAATSENILNVFAELTRQHGREFTILDSTGAPTQHRPEDPSTLILPTDEFSIVDHEMITGNDTENSI